MKHLTVDEMIDFVSLSRLDAESLALASKVNAHLADCGECRKKITAFQTVYDEFVRIGRKKNLDRNETAKLAARELAAREEGEKKEGQIDDLM